MSGGSKSSEWICESCSKVYSSDGMRAPGSVDSGDSGTCIKCGYITITKQLERSGAANDEASKSLTAANEKITTLSKERDNLRTEITHRISTLDQQLADRENAFKTKERELEARDRAIVDLKREVSNLVKSRDAEQRTIDGLRKQLAESQQEAINLKKSVTMSREELSKGQAGIFDIQKQHDIYRDGLNAIASVVGIVPAPIPAVDEIKQGVVRMDQELKRIQQDADATAARLRVVSQQVMMGNSPPPKAEPEDEEEEEEEPASPPKERKRRKPPPPDDTPDDESEDLSGDRGDLLIALARAERMAAEAQTLRELLWALNDVDDDEIAPYLERRRAEVRREFIKSKDESASPQITWVCTICGTTKEGPGGDAKTFYANCVKCKAPRLHQREISNDETSQDAA